MLKGHNGHICCLKMSPNHEIFATAGQDYDIRIWELREKKEIEILRGHFGDIWNLEFLSDEQLVSVSTDGQIIIWDLKRFEAIKTYSSSEEYWGLAYDNKLEVLATGTVNGQVIIWDIKNLKKINTLDCRIRHIRQLIFLTGKETLIIGQIDGTFDIWNFKHNKVDKVHIKNSSVKTIAINSKLKMIITGTEDGMINIHNWNTFKINFSIDNAHSDSLGKVIIINQNEIISSGHDGTIAIWDIISRKLIRRFKVRFSNDNFSCENLKLKNIQGLTNDRLKHLIKQGATLD